ncbi:MAG: chromophore lyase CpcT/CpeT [Woeseiaceae bacterium]|nr:chromophore lyase CpcT/CpeT [Woeseiaceae bacterium]
MIRSAVFLALLLSGAPAIADELHTLARMMDGRFATHAETLSQAVQPDDQFVDWRQRILAPSLGDHVFYQQLNQGTDLELYRQRVFVLRLNPDTDSIEQHTFRLRHPQRYVDARAGDAAFEGFSADDVEPYFKEGCIQIWTRTDDGFRGYLDPDTCRIVSSRTGKPRLIEAENLLTPDSLSIAERGYDESHQQLFGTPPNELLRLTESLQTN